MSNGEKMGMDMYRGSGLGTLDKTVENGSYLFRSVGVRLVCTNVIDGCADIYFYLALVTTIPIRIK